MYVWCVCFGSSFCPVVRCLLCVIINLFAHIHLCILVEHVVCCWRWWWWWWCCFAIFLLLLYALWICCCWCFYWCCFRCLFFFCCFGCPVTAAAVVILARNVYDLVTFLKKKQIIVIRSSSCIQVCYFTVANNLKYQTKSSSKRRIQRCTSTCIV